MFGENKSGDNFVEDSEVRMPMPFKDSTIDLKKMFYSKVVDNVTGEVNNLGANVLKDWPTYKEDNPHVYITDDMIKGVIEDNIDELIKEIREEI